MSVVLSLIAIAISLWSLYRSRRSLGRTYALRATTAREAAATCRDVGDTEGVISTRQLPGDSSEAQGVTATER